MGSIRRRLMTQRDSGNSGLPAGYYLCEYIEATGAQWIDTGIVPDNNTRMVLDFAVTNTTETTNNIAGTRNTTSSQAFAFSTLNGYWRFGYNTSSPSTTVAVDTERHIVDINKNVLSLDGNVIYTATAATFTGYSTIYLGAIKASSSGYVGYVKLYGCKIYDNGVLVRDFIPCVSPAGDFGMYDTVTKLFFESVSTTKFRGKVVIPENYTWLEYIYSGGNAWIDTGYQHDQRTRVVMRAQMVGTPTADAYFFGGASSSDKYKDVFYHKNTGYIMATYGASGDYTYVQAGVNNLLEIDYDGHICSVSVVNGGTEAYQFDPGLFQSTVNLALFCSNYNNSPRGYMTGRLYLCEIWDRGTLIRLYIPCVNKNSVYGLYDMVEGKFYSSAGAGQFGEEPVLYDFAYTGGEQSVTLKPGTYKLECWGAQGGSYNTSIQGGKGSYISGVYKVENNTDVYINVGGQGQNNSTGTLNKGGYNGGGDGGQGTVASCAGGGGGGATHIATSSGLLKAIDDSALIIVAGAGGGYGGAMDNAYSGGFGHSGPGADGAMNDSIDGSGGHSGTSVYPGLGGTEGYGSKEDENDDYYNSGAGGGGGSGYIGGGGGGSGGISAVSPRAGMAGSNGSFGQGGSGGKGVGRNGWWAGDGGGGAGGSAFAASSLTSVSLLAGNTSMPSITGGTETGHAGNGYARITKIA